MTDDTDVTNACAFGNPDDETLPLTKCVCGKVYGSWDMTLSIYRDSPTEMPCCGAQLYFSQRIRIHQVEP